ncbi:M20 aminoacylase family protein [Lentisalinibacter orientalis]|uniref:M20 aminoacylase family protein n=1 Tax=Lentisalinibacter orientalis TaxID=2992241 RepID=UPI00386F1208
MELLDRIRERQQALTAWRHHIHAHPELAYEEKATSDFVAEKLAAFGLEVHRGLGVTGVVGTLRAGNSDRAIGLRADMDALPIQELNEFEHRSRHPGLMHACGHDGHTTMLLGAAEHLAANPDFDGVVHFIFQPAEEGRAGAKAMIEDGLFDLFPVESVYGMHNWPGLPVGEFAVRVGPQMAASDKFEITVRGRGGHAAMPHQTIDPVVTAAHIITALQSLASRNTEPTDSVVVSVTVLRGGETFNVIPDEVVLKGTARTLTPESRDRIERDIARVAAGVAAGFGATAETTYHRTYPPTVNTPDEAEIAARAAAAVAGAGNVHRDLPPTMGGEDFAFMLEEKPGCYLWLGNGPGEGGCMLHNARYDFNDEALPIGVAYWVSLVGELLGRAERAPRAA